MQASDEDTNETRDGQDISEEDLSRRMRSFATLSTREEIVRDMRQKQKSVIDAAEIVANAANDAVIAAKTTLY